MTALLINDCTLGKCRAEGGNSHFSGFICIFFAICLLMENKRFCSKVKIGFIAINSLVIDCKNYNTHFLFKVCEKATKRSDDEGFDDDERRG